MIFKTLNGSIYEYEAGGPTGPRARRLVRSATSEAERPGQGEWRACLGMIGPVLGDNALIHWRNDAHGTAQCSVTSAVIEIES